jgi:NAD(P)-dependent dehydrogenase (short-subunit alcohol dehydrogenase family)
MYLAHELGPQGIAVNSINPGLIETDSSKMYSGGEEGYAQYVRDVLPQTPAGRVGRPEDVAAVTAFLCSEDADFIRGQTLLVDGGLLSSSVASRPHG